MAQAFLAQDPVEHVRWCRHVKAPGMAAPSGMTPDWASMPGARKQEDADALYLSQKDYITRVGRRNYQHVQEGKNEFMSFAGDRIPPIEMKAPRDNTRTPLLEPDALDVYIYWPPPPPAYEGRKRPVLLFLHGANVAKDQQGIGWLGDHVWFLERLPKELVVLIPICNDRQRRPWVSASVKATLLYIVEQAVESGGDPDRVYVTGLSMGGIAAWELAMDSAEGRAPFAAAVPVCGMMLNKQRLSSLVDYPLWAFHAANDQINSISDDDEAMGIILAAGANRGREPTLRYSRYERGPPDMDLISGFPTPDVGHLIWYMAYAEKELWPWLLEQRRDLRRFKKPGVVLKDGTLVPGGRHQGEVDERQLGIKEHIHKLIEAQQKHLREGGKDLVMPGREPIPPIRLQGERDDTRKPPLEPDAIDFFFVWPPKPEKSTEEKRPALLFLHGGWACQEEGGLVGLASEAFWVPRVPEDMVVIIPHTRSRNQHWLLRSVKATLLYAIEKAVKLGVDPDRVYVTGLSMGGTAALEFALSSAEGQMPFAASVPVTPYVMSVKRARLLADFPTWLFCGCNEWESLLARIDDAIETAVEAGANLHREDPTLLCTKYAWSPDTNDPGMYRLRNSGHGTFYQAYVEPELWTWVLSQRRGMKENQAILAN
uniref:Phospholipase/carboxylesterase/thioesterase domain-containing protein n=1 Tax=Alexandrium monilatum TaxID=311494 RepID=A0A7S4VX28_9DINO